MSFLGWTFLFGAVAVIGPIAAHLLSKPRFRRVPFTMLRFLRSGQRESHSRRRLRDVLILLLRCAAIVLIAVLFARPVQRVTLPPPEHQSMHYLALDDSMSMAYRDGDETLFERMTEAAIEHVTRAPDNAGFGLYALASGRLVYDLNKAQALAEIRRLKPVPKSATLAGFFTALSKPDPGAPGLSPNDTLSAVIFSDFSPSILAQFERIGQPAFVDPGAPGFGYELVAPAGPVDNMAIVGAQVAEVTEKGLDVDVTVANYSAAQQQRELTAQVHDLDPVVMPLDLAPRQHGVFRVHVSFGPSRKAQAYVPLELTLSAQDGLAADDSYRVAAYVPPAAPMQLLLVGRARQVFLFETAVRALSQSRRAGTHLDLRKATPDGLTSSDLAWANVAVFSSLPESPACGVENIRRFLSAGGKLICFATQEQAQEVARRLWQAELLPALPEIWIDETAYPEAVGCAPRTDLSGFAGGVQGTPYGLDRVAVKGMWRCRTDPQAQCLWRFAGGEGFIYARSVGQGMSVFVNTSMDDSLGLLAKSRAWVAFCRHLLGRSSQMRQFAFSTAERPVVVLPETGDLAQLAVQNCDGQRTTARVVGHPGAPGLHMPEPAGIGWMKTLDGPEVYAAINLPDGETDLNVPAAETVAAAIERAFVANPDAKEGVARAGAEIKREPVWQWFAWGAIALLLTEAAVANRLRR